MRTLVFCALTQHSTTNNDIERAPTPSGILNMSTTKLFQPFQIGRARLDHRVVMAPLTRLRADHEHVQLPMAVEYYSQRASKGGLIISEGTIIAPKHGGTAHMPGIWSDAQIARWREITDAVHDKGGSMFCQLISLGRVADANNLEAEGKFTLIGPSPTPLADSTGPTPHELSKEEIQASIRAFEQAAKNAIAAGFDGVEIHGANGYLVDQFTQDTANQRTDDYGGSVENRARFGVEVAKAVVKAVGSDRVGYRISPFSSFHGMKMDEPISQFSHLVRELRNLGLAYLHVIESRVINNVDCEKKEGIEPLLEAWGTERPVIVAGGFTAELARHAVDTEYSDHPTAVAFGRRFLANPDLPYRLREGCDLNKYDRSTFYAPMQREGYTDYPFFSDGVSAA
jgi:NADPH2 dehydrogenase